MCIFCDIASKKIPSKAVFEDDDFLAFHDVNPVAPSHVLVIPKKHIASLTTAGPDDEALLGRLLPTAKRVAELVDGSALGYRLVINSGRQAGQSVDHLHAHILAGRAMAWPPG